MEVLQRTANRGSISTGYDIENSLKFEADNSEYLSWSNMSSYATDARKRTWSISFWCKRTEIGQAQLPWNSGGNGTLAFQAADHINFQQFFSDSASAAKYLNTNRLFRDPSAWYHIIIAIDTTQSTEAHRMRLYVNGEEETSFASTVYPPQNATATDIYGSYISLGRSLNWGAGFSGYIADYYFISEVQLVPTDVGEFDEDSGIWKPKAYAGAITAPSTFLEFKDSSNFKTATSGLDASVSSNLTAADQATDTPTNNFCTLNPVMLTAANTVISQGATSLFSTGASGNTVVGTIGVSRGKWYWEFKHISTGGTAYWSSIGYTSSESTDSTQTAGNSGTPSKVALLPNGSIFVNGTILGGKFNTFSVNDIAGVALDMDNGDMYLYKNGTIQNSGNPIFTSIGDFAMPVGSVQSNGCGGYFNFGGFTSYTPASAATDENGYGTFEYAPPSGYYALCTKNLAEYG